MNEYSKIITDNKTGIHLFAGDWDDIVPVDNTIKNIEKLGYQARNYGEYGNSYGSGYHHK